MKVYKNPKNEFELASNILSNYALENAENCIELILKLSFLNRIYKTLMYGQQICMGEDFYDYLYCSCTDKEAKLINGATIKECKRALR